MSDIIVGKHGYYCSDQCCTGQNENEPDDILERLDPQEYIDDGGITYLKDEDVITSEHGQLCAGCGDQIDGIQEAMTLAVELIDEGDFPKESIW